MKMMRRINITLLMVVLLTSLTAPALSSSSPRVQSLTITFNGRPKTYQNLGSEAHITYQLSGSGEISTTAIIELEPGIKLDIYSGLLNPLFVVKGGEVVEEDEQSISITPKAGRVLIELYGTTPEGEESILLMVQEQKKPLLVVITERSEVETVNKAWLEAKSLIMEAEAKLEANYNILPEGKRKEAETYIELAHLHLEAGNYEKSMRYAKLALQLAEPTLMDSPWLGYVVPVVGIVVAGCILYAVIRRLRPSQKRGVEQSTGPKGLP